MPATQTLSAARSRKRTRRKTVFINPGFQWRYALLAGLIVFFVAVIMCAAMYGVLYDQARARTLALAPASPWENTISLVGFAGAFALVMSAAFGLWGVLVSHRICGPLYVMQQYFEQLAGGRLPQMRGLRRKDEFKALYESMRFAVGKLREQRATDLNGVCESLDLVNSIQTGQETVRAQALSALRDRLDALQKDASAALGYTSPASDDESVATQETVAT
jgi:hypothetical protein